jgi:glycine cleavage system H protein
MYNVPEELRYTVEHEWARLDEDGRITIGITDFAQDQLGDVVFLELPSVDDPTTSGEPLGEIESTKSVSDLYAPVTGTVTDVNADVKDNPAAVNEDPYGEGWMLVIEPSDSAQFDALLSADEYEALLEEQAAESE